MKFNIGNADRIIRLIIAIVISLPVSTGFVNGSILVITLDTIAAILIITSALDYCPLYALFGISTVTIKGITKKGKKAGYRSK